jgi:hypothetical protein
LPPWLCSGGIFPLLRTHIRTCKTLTYLPSAGLVCFCYASQNHIVAVVVLILTALCTFGLGAVSLWFVAERWAYSRHQGVRWLADVIEENWVRLCRLPGLGHITRAILAAWRMLVVALRWIRSALRRRAGGGRSGRTTTDSESLPTTSPDPRDAETRTPSPVLLRRNYTPTFTFGDVAHGVADKIHASHLGEKEKERKARLSEDASVSVRLAAYARVNSAMSEPPSSPLDLDSPTSPGPGPGTAPAPTSDGALTLASTSPGGGRGSSGGGGGGAANRFRSVAWRIAKAGSPPPSAATGVGAGVGTGVGAPDKAKVRQGTTLVSERKRAKTIGDAVTAKSKIHALRPELKKLEIMHMMDAHVALVR